MRFKVESVKLKVKCWCNSIFYGLTSGLWVLGFGGVVFSAVKEEEWKPILSPIRLNFEVGLGYDNNIFKYSPEDIDKFVNNEDPVRFSRVESYDDFVTYERVVAEFRRQLIDERMRIRFKYTRHHYAVNPIKNYQSLILNLRQEFFKKNYLEIGYLLIPQYYIRDYYDDDFRDWMRCDFREHLLAIKLGREIMRKTRATLIYKCGVYDYNSYFDEYDTKSNLLGANISYRFKGNPDSHWGLGLRTLLPRELKFEYIYKDARAKGYDEEGENRITSDESDISYRGNNGMLDLAWDIVGATVKVGYKYEHRDYTTKKPIEVAPWHRDRKDRKQTFSGGVEIKIAPALLSNILYTYTRRDTFSPRKAEITEVKDYTNHIISVALIFIVK